MSSLPDRRKPPLPPGAERRRFERFDLFAQVELELDGDVLVLPIKNISAGGLLLQADPSDLAAIELDAAVTVHLDVTELAEPLAITMQASVVRVVGGPSPSIAVMWTSVDANAVMKLAKLLEYLRARD